MSIASKIREKIDKMFHESPPEPIIHYGPYDALWPTIGVDHYGWFCHWCGLPSRQLDTLPQSRRDAMDHVETHPEETFHIVQVYPDPDES